MNNTTNCNQIAGKGEGAPVNTTNRSNDTYWVQGMIWLCGQRAYFILPPGWTGVCAPIFVSDHTFKITVRNTTMPRRRRQDISAVQLHDPIYGSDVPEEFKLWTVPECLVQNQQSTKWRALSLTRALEGLKTLNEKMKEHSGVDTSMWDSWMDMFGKYRTLVSSILVSMAVFAAILTLCGCCCIPCIRALINRLIVTAITPHVTFHQETMMLLTHQDRNTDFEEEDNF